MQEDNLSDITLTPRIPSAEENPFIPMAQKMAQPEQIGLNPPEDNPFLAIAKGMGGEGQPPAIGSIASTLSINPDQAAQASKLGGQFGLGQDIALRNMDELRRRSLITRLQQTGMLENNPALAESLANPAFSAQAHDDIDNLAETGSWIDSISKGFEGGLLMQEMGELRFSPLSGERFYGATPAQQERIEQVRKRMQETQGSGILYMTAQVIAQQLAQAKGIGTAALTGFGIGAATGGAPGAVAGGGVGAATGVVLTTAQMEAGLLYDELEQAGVDPETATTAAVIGGTINGAIELLGAKVAAAPFRPLIRKLIADRVEALAMPTMRSAAKGFAKGYATQVGTETLEETVQEITAMATSEIAKAADGIDSETTWKDALTRITDAAIGGFQGSLLLGGIGPGANAIVDTRRAKQTEAQQKWLDGLQERVAESKVRERNPNAFQEFVEKQVEGKPVATIYVDAEEAKGVLAQLNLTASQVDAIVPGFAEQVRAESDRGGDVTIPTAVFSAKLANTDLGNALRPHMRLSPEALSVTQLEAVRAERERMSAAGQDVIDERMAAEDTAFVESAQRVEDTMYGELTAAGQPATEAKINAEFVRNMMASLADRVGVTPEQMFERYPYRVRGEGQAAPAQALEQAVTPAPESGVFDVNNPPTAKPGMRDISQGPAIVALMDYDGTVYYDVNATMHGDLIDTFPEIADTVIDGGFIIDGKYVMNASDGGYAAEEGGSERMAEVRRFTKQVNTRNQRPLAQASRLDADYMASVERGYMEAAQRMVDEAAIEAGYTVGPVYHGTFAKFNKFDLYRATGNDLGFHFGDNAAAENRLFDLRQEQPQRFAKAEQRILRVRLRMENPLRLQETRRNAWQMKDVLAQIFDGETVLPGFEQDLDAYLGDELESRVGGKWVSYADLSDNRADQTEWLGNLLLDKGYDGVVYENRVEGGTSYIVYDPNRIKLADPVTYDEAGNVVPLSRRFDITSPMVFEQAASRTALDVQHQEAIRAGDIATAQALTDSVAETRMPDSEVRDEAGKILRVFHGTQRIDRVGNRLLKKRATSGPMPFFTNTRAIAEGYAQGKQDTSIEDIGYEQWVKYTPKGKRSKVTLDQAWFYLTPEQKATATERLFTTGYENPEEGTGAIVGNTDTIASRDHVEYLLREARGNALTAAKELWLNSGSLFNNEQEFMDVLRGMGLTERFVYDSPHAVNSGILEVYLNITNPLDTAAIPESVVEALQRRANRIRRPAAQYGRDPWDKETRNPQEWMATLRSDIAEGKTQAWTSVPDWVTDVLRGLGYDGIKDMGGKFGGEQHTVWIPFEPEQVKFADAIAKDASGRIIPLSERFDVTSPMMFEQRPVTPGFYSALEREVGAIDAKALTADGWNQRLQGLVNKGVVKQDEIEWSGLKDWIAMQEGKVSKDTVLEFLRGNGVKVAVVRLGDRQQAVDQAAIAGSFVAEDNLRESDDGLTPEVEAAFNTFRTLIETGASREDIAEQRFIINDALDNAFGTDLDYYVESEYEARPETRYQEYTLPGGTNYREVLLKLPVSEPQIVVSNNLSVAGEKEVYHLSFSEIGREGPTSFVVEQSDGSWKAQYLDEFTLRDTKESAISWARARMQPSAPRLKALAGFSSTHWQERNVLVHLRMNDRVDADGKRVLFVEEVQSDWGQAGRKKGFRPSDARRTELFRAMSNTQKVIDTSNPGTPENEAARQKMVELETAVEEFNKQYRESTIPLAPFVETTEGWLNLGLKQIMLEAVTGNYDRVAFVNGEQSADRYDLSKRVSLVSVNKQADGRYLTYIEGIDGTALIRNRDGFSNAGQKMMTAEELEATFGKEVAKQAIEGKPNKEGWVDVRGDNLRVGGEGMKSFYDNIVPAAMNKLLKKYGGGKLGVATIDQTATDDPLSYEGEFRFRNENDVEAFLTDVSIAGLEQYDYGRQDDGNIVSFRLPGNVYEQFRELAENRNGRYETPRLIQEGEIERPAVTKLETQQLAFDITPAMVEKLATGLPLFQAARGLARGGFDPQKLMTTLNKDADFSTFAHETAHYFLTILGDVAARPDAPASVVDDMNTLLRWFGVKDLATWNAMSLDQQRQYHEQFAYSFETYLFEGKAPSVEMQGLFDQFARWLKQVYQGLITKINDVYKAEFGKDLPILTGEVRQVMDRMLATEDQIARAQAIREMKPQFQTQEQSGMDDATWAAYQELQEQATERAVAELTTATLKEMAWMSRARGRKLRELQRQHDDKRKEIKDEVTEDLRILPVYRAMEFLKRGKVVDVDGTTKPATGQFKLSLAGVQAVMPPGFDVATLGRGRYGMVNEDGLHPDLIAPLYGYANGAELVTALSTAKPFADAVAERTDQRMLSEFSELADPAARSLAVDRAIHNEARARLIAVEQRWAAKLQQPVSVIMEAASQVAGEVIGRQTIRTLSPRAYAAAEARAARLATSAYTEPQSPEQAGQTAATRAYNAAIAAGKTVDEATAESLSAGVAAVEKARERRAEFDKKYGGKSPAEVMMRAKRQQLLQNMLARQALEARAEIDRARSAFKRFFGSDEKIGKTRNMEMVSAARAILGWYGFGKRDKSPAEYVDQLKAYNPAAYAQLEPLILRATKGPQDYRDLTVDEFRVLRDTVDGLWIQARKDKQVKLADRTMALDEVVGELDKRLEEIGVPNVVPGEKRAPTFRDRAARHLMTLRSTMRRVESWADSMDGVSTVRPFTNYLVRPVLEAVDKFTASRNKYMKRFRDLVVNLQMPEGTISAPELDYTFGAGNAGIGKAELLGALLHTGNASNYRKLLLGRGWGQEDEFGNLDDTQFKAFVKRMQDEGILTKADYDFLQSVWDLNEEIKPIAQKAHYELYGFYFTEIPASEVVTPFGTYRGGYVPAATDKFMVADAAQRAGEEELESDWRNSLPSTGRGFTQTRVAGYNKALSLDVRVIGAHIHSALRFSMIQPAITQALRILRSREFAARLDRVDPTVKQELLIPWLNRTARQLVSQPGKYKAVDSFWRGVRTRTGMSIMFANLRNALQQFTGLFPAGLKVQPRYLTSALTEYVGSPQRTANSVAALSPFMEDRLKGQSFEMQEQINEVLLNPSKFDKAQAWTDRHGYFLQQAFQNMVDVVTWVGAYNQSLSTADTTVTAEEAQREAIAAGDAAVRLTQGSVRPSDVSAFESGTPFFRTLTQFAGYFNMLANLNSTEYVKVMRDMGFRGNKGKLVYIYMMGFMLPAVVADAIVRTLGGGWEDEDEDGYLDTFMDWFFGSQIRQGVAFVPFGTTAYTLATTAFDDKPYNDRMTTSPSVASLEAATVGVGKAAIAVVDEEKDVTGKNVRDVLTFLSLATGIPFSVLGRPAGYLVDVQRGEVEPTSTYDMIRGTITGTATPESKR